MSTKKPKTAPKSAPKKAGDASENLQDLFVDGLKDMYYVENTLTGTLQEMYDLAADPKLKTALKDHLAQTEQQIARLENVFESLGLPAEGKKCAAMDGIIEEGRETVSKAVEGPVRDTAIISSSQKVEHYEISSYGTLIAYAKTLNELTAQDLLLRSLGEEKKSDTLLSNIADTTLNSQAVKGEHQSKDINAV